MFTYKIGQEIYLALPTPKRDAKSLFKIIDESRDELGVWLPWVSNMQSEADEEKFLTQTMTHFATGFSLNVIILYENQPAGMISFNKFRTSNQSAEIGYWLGTKFVGRGIMHRAVAGMCNLAFNDYRLNKVEIHAAVENQPSNRVAKKAGFHFDGSVRAAELLADGFHDENIWSLLKEEWQRQK